MAVNGGTLKGGAITQGLISSDVPGGTLRADSAGTTLVVRVTPFTNTGKIEELNGGKVSDQPVAGAELSASGCTLSLQPKLGVA